MKQNKMAQYFTIEEFCKSGSHPDLAETPKEGTIEYSNLQRLMAVMDIIREKWGSPILITSGFRPEKLNKAVGGSKTSAHRYALAADFHPKNGDILKLAALIVNSGIKFDQLILEKIIRNNNRIGGCQWIHLGLTNGVPRKQILAYDGKRYLPVKVNNTTSFSL